MTDERAVDAADVVAIVRASGLAVTGAVTALDAGVSVEAWRAESDGGPLVVLVERAGLAGGERRQRAAFEARHALLAQLHPRDPRCPRPLATQADAGAADPLSGARSWAVATFVAGTPLDPDRHADAARELGVLLRALHDLPAAGHGMLADERGALRGLADDPTAGLLLRWPWLWPFDGRPLVAHPVVRAAPALVGGLAALRAPLLRWADPAIPTAVCHGDLKPNHARIDADGRLAGLIDFGDAMVAPRAWDLATFAWHAGWPAVDALLEGYEPKRLLRESLRAEAEHLVVPLVLGYFERDVRRGAPAGETGEAPRTLAFLADAVPRALRHAR